MGLVGSSPTTGIMDNTQNIKVAAYCVEQYLRAIQTGNFRSAVRIAQHIYLLTRFYAIQEERQYVGIPIITYPDDV